MVEGKPGPQGCEFVRRAGGLADRPSGFLTLPVADPGIEREVFGPVRGGAFGDVTVSESGSPGCNGSPQDVQVLAIAAVVVT